MIHRSTRPKYTSALMMQGCLKHWFNEDEAQHSIMLHKVTIKLTSMFQNTNIYWYFVLPSLHKKILDDISTQYYVAINIYHSFYLGAIILLAVVIWNHSHPNKFTINITHFRWQMTPRRFESRPTPRSSATRRTTARWRLRQPWSVSGP